MSYDDMYMLSPGHLWSICYVELLCSNFLSQALKTLKDKDKEMIASHALRMITSCACIQLRPLVVHSHAC